MSQHDDTDSRAVEQLAGNATANEPVYSPISRSTSDEFSWVPSPELAGALAKMCADLISAIEAERNKPLIPGQPSFRGRCLIHPGSAFPERATKSGAREDLSSHIHQPGGHHVLLDELEPGTFEFEDEVDA